MKYLLRVIAAALMYVMILVTTACPTESQIRRAAKTSNQISILVDKTVDATTIAFTNQVISLQTKDKMAVQLKLLISGGKVFNTAVKEINDAVKSGSVPQDKWTLLNALFSDNVLVPFNQLLIEMKLITSGQAAALWVAVSALRSAILLIAGVLGKSLSVGSLPTERNRYGYQTG